ncbi:FAD-dependent thymidylate synthase [Candidatus Woesearchaeota archaeon]|nr:FAD-dependent thymidylate synthase [Candidatus Woesearchaeota archaeon]MBT5272108.1 FAD-dependent thymidylate synthase [Candidatus Woesearchaeota archaeon]MBT6040911.1 FAD-dependent thymidylate synthase [Candidatus Woesearchaeota archaeon]MBT6336245.1 FAD-dependent thymidylate synthase [Candidatus Woesearchaeota archaeon]MBT7927228.1 FAD-dependent thymidylate synthase [Candidatus Woesearchaeota archaeon]
MEKEVFTEEEKVLLKKHVTDIENPIYCIKNLPEEVVAVLFAYVSRSPNSFKRNLLKLLGSGDLNLDVNKVSDMYGDAASMQEAKQKAMKFHEKWVVGYGHGSVAEHASIKFAIDKLSIVATKILEDNRLGSYTEKSTRYQVFDKNVFYWDPKLMSSEFQGEVRELVHLLFDTYEKFLPIVTEKVKAKNPRDVEVNERAYENSIKAKVCDVIRYLLPAGTLTAMGFTFNARAAEHAIRKLLSHPLTEAREVGQKLLEEGSKICPTLLQFAGHNNFISETNKEMKKLSQSILKKDVQTTLSGAKTSEDPNIKPVKTICVDENAEDKIIAAILYEHSQLSFNDVYSEVKALPREEKEKVFDEYVKRRGAFDRPMRAWEHAFFTTEIVCDYGAFRDIQRHRMNTQTNQIFNTHLGYEIPDEITEFGLKEEYVAVMEKARTLYEKLETKFPYEAQYFIPLAFRVRVLFRWNLRELEHFIRLRSSVQGHISYIKIARLCWAEIDKKYPLLAKYITLNMDEEYLGRLRGEIETQKKMDKVKEKYGD